MKCQLYMFVVDRVSILLEWRWKWTTFPTLHHLYSFSCILIDVSNIGHSRNVSRSWVSVWDPSDSPFSLHVLEFQCWILQALHYSCRLNFYIKIMRNPRQPTSFVLSLCSDDNVFNFSAIQTPLILSFSINIVYYLNILETYGLSLNNSITYL
jgi:hypothetical protein